MKVFTPEEMREVDSLTISDRGVSEFSLMENAALAAFFIIQKNFPIKGSKIAVICGGGNNGGDGLALSRKLFSQGADVFIVTAVPEEKFRGTALQNYKAALNYGIPIFNPISAEKLIEKLKNSQLIVDALLGTGLRSKPRDLYKDYIRIINQAKKPVVSLDIPSGADGSDGTLPGEAIHAEMTIAFGGPKWGNVLYPAATENGKLFYSRLSFSPSDIDSPKIRGNILIPAPPPERDQTGHKGSFGRILTIGGAKSYFGAPAFSAKAVLKSGAGYSYLASPENITASWAPHAPELVFLPQKTNENGNISLENKDSLLEIANKVKGIILGPGLSRDKETLSLAAEIIKNTNNPILLDGDGLGVLTSEDINLQKHRAPLILTPHRGEFAELAKIPVKSIQTDLLKTVRIIAEKWNAILVLKGPHSLVVFPDGDIYANLTGNSGMGTAGSGDVLCGVIMGLYAQGMELGEAVKAGVFLHGLAGEKASERLGEAGVTASDILSHLPEARISWKQGDYTLPLEQVL